ncbi:harpin HrpN-like [Macrobrachium rosenbergii]|uniref:harpin HrpN-like n=1 Tax=Macrobrachium rosenbergii TaxID=79674 RepID=UPI0034D4D77C
MRAYVLIVAIALVCSVAAIPEPGRPYGGGFGGGRPVGGVRPGLGGLGGLGGGLGEDLGRTGGGLGGGLGEDLGECMVVLED